MVSFWHMNRNCSSKKACLPLTDMRQHCLPIFHNTSVGSSDSLSEYSHKMRDYTTVIPNNSRFNTVMWQREIKWEGWEDPRSMRLSPWILITTSLKLEDKRVKFVLEAHPQVSLYQFQTYTLLWLHEVWKPSNQFLPLFYDSFLVLKGNWQA